MTATFGKLREQTLELGDGLNILQAPNETGKSTWCAFLLSMLYGINSRERERARMQVERERLKSTLLRSISHDLRTPLTGITGSAGFLLDNLEIMDEEAVKTMLKDI